MSSETEALPKLPLPNVQATMDRYLDAVKAVVSDKDFDRTTKLVKDFLKDDSTISEIEKHLAQRAEDKENWSYEYWIDDMYFNNPVPLPINSSPGWIFPRQTFLGERGRSIYLARMVKGLLDYKQRFESGTPLDPELVPSKTGNKQALCMEQYYRIFTTYRYPGEPKDFQKVDDGRRSRETETIIVMNDGHVTVKANDAWIDEASLAKLIFDIESRDDLDHLPWNARVSTLTSCHRHQWSQNRDVLISDLVNADSLKRIESCLMIVCLDEPQQNLSDTDLGKKAMFRQVLDGYGPFVSGSNRWFDKTIQIICSRDGVSGLCYEHSVAEGIAVVSVITSVLNSITDKDEVKLDPNIEVDKNFKVDKLEFKVTQEIQARIEGAVMKFKSLSDDVHVEVFNFRGFGKDFMKRSKCSPDAFVQLTLQRAYFRLHGKLCFSYESASTRRFRQGRVDNIRSSHPQALEWVKAMNNKGLGKDEKVKLFKNAIAKQVKIMTENINGEGMDIPMLGIREALKEVYPDKDLPELFRDEVYQSSNLFQLSTSQVPISLPESFMGYGAVVPNGYGVSYNLHNDNIIFCISSFFSDLDTHSLRFCQSLDQSLAELYNLLQ